METCAPDIYVCIWKNELHDNLCKPTFLIGTRRQLKCFSLETGALLQL
jgi:hypothetical protein